MNYAAPITHGPKIPGFTAGRRIKSGALNQPIHHWNALGIPEPHRVTQDHTGPRCKFLNRASSTGQA
jgi:hypothetical protein